MDKMLADLSGQGATREVIARSLTILTGSLVTKNAVCGRASRIGVISERTLNARRMKANLIPGNSKKTVKSNRYFNVPISKSKLPSGDNFTLKGNPGGCLYMEGDARDRRFCGAPTVRRSPTGFGCWCADHYRIVFRVEAKAA